MAKAAGEFTMWARNNPVAAALAARSWESFNKEDLAARRWESLNEQDGIYDPQGNLGKQPAGTQSDSGGGGAASTGKATG
eukprot:6661279-Heterocapsa_arctica.AAC.1